MLGCGWAVMVMIMAYTIATYLVGFIASTAQCRNFVLGHNVSAG